MAPLSTPTEGAYNGSHAVSTRMLRLNIRTRTSIDVLCRRKEATQWFMNNLTNGPLIDTYGRGGMWTMTTYKEDEVICTNSQTWMDKKYELSNMTRKMSSNFNIHILLQLLYYFGVKNEVDSLDRASIVVYSCEVSCEGSRAYKEKFVGVQLASQSSSVCLSKLEVCLDDFVFHTIFIQLALGGNK
ncbi:hypothetical protein Vadar_025235 [Vaccinium darrowii]|uniref:Uncharacterized protein n=1 Tax=Vaccinium darrowii TaxID=229202 RepID=A0ACB7Z648_9ERIC|nr:hypothetical protein Vadar_025235 [Vaccinium darrowii]